jgi:hypothetical protein
MRSHVQSFSFSWDIIQIFHVIVVTIQEHFTEVP